MAKKRREPPGNFVSEWFGHRVYPSIVTTEESVKDQQGEGCPFLSRAVGETRTCIKSEAAKGVCTISSVSNGTRQDWLVCPYRALSPDLVADAIQRLFNIPPALQPFITPAVTLIKSDVRADIAARLGRQQPAFVYFDKKTGGELSIPSTPRSPEFSFDVTVVEITSHNNEPLIGRFGILEIQTMDFHGSYRNAVRNLREMQPGDKLIIYHTGEEKSAVGTASVVSVKATDPKLPVVEIKAGKTIAEPKSLAEIKASSRFAGSPLVRQGRLSVVPLTASQYEWLAGK